MLALHEECLTRRYFLHILDFLEGLMGIGLSGLGTLKSQRKLGLSSLRVTLQTLLLFHESLDLLLYLRHPRLLLLSLSALRGRITFGRGHRLLQGRHLVSGPCNTHVILVICLATKSFSVRYNFSMVLLTFLVLELLLGTVELVLGPLEALLQSIDLRSQCGRGQQRSLQSHIEIFFMTPTYIFLDPQSGFSFRTPNRAYGATVYAVLHYIF